jgi:6-phosphogluconolactonase
MTEKPESFAVLEISRRHLLALSLAGLALSAASTMAFARSSPTFVYVGSYTKDPPGGGSNNPEGISVLRFDPTKGGLTTVQQVKSANPSFVALDPSHRFLYAINEVDDYEGNNGSVEAYAIDPNNGTLKLLNRQSTKGPIPAHLSVDPT